ncbi:MAG: CARDB domain-containing protein [Acidobacteriota bacterium]
MTSPGGVRARNRARLAGVAAAALAFASPVAGQSPPPRPDLVVERWRTPASAAAGSSLTAAIRLTNTGQGSAGRFVSELRLQRAGPASARIAKARWEVTGVAPGQSAQREVALAVPPGLAAGEYVLRVVADVDSAVAEKNEQNNVAERTLRITAPKDS